MILLMPYWITNILKTVRSNEDMMQSDSGMSGVEWNDIYNSYPLSPNWQHALSLGSMRLLGDLLCCYDLLCPIRCSFKFAFFQLTFHPFYKEPFRRYDQFSSFSLESICDRLGGIAK